MRVLALLALPLILIVAACQQRDGDGGDDRSQLAYSGGELGTVFLSSSNAFQEPLPELTEAEAARHLAGDGMFDATFVTAPSPVFPGLGPLFNNSGCGACHVKEGRGSPEVGKGPQGSQMLVMVSLPTGEPAVPGGTVDVPGLGSQVRDQAVFGQEPNATVSLTWIDEAPGAFGDGTPYQLRRPTATITLADGSAIPADTIVSLRQPLQVYGLGLLEAIPEAVIRARATDPNKVPGRVNEVWSRAEQRLVVGRFGRKAGLPNIREQAAKAFSLDVGITNELFVSGEETPGAAFELSLEEVDLAAYYLRTIAVPARRSLDDPTAQRGEELFRQAGCIGCHVEEWQTGDHEIASLANQTIRPYSDLLLHDMGVGLADGRSEYAAGGQDWRTPTLWGIGLATTVLPQATYLHDGRARSLPEAILWHGGQAQGPREFFRNLPAADRDALVAFLRSL